MTAQARIPNGALSAPTRGSLADPFAEARAKDGAKMIRIQDEDLMLLLTWMGGRAAARDPQAFDSSQLGRVPIPPETGIRSFRQLPIETNPPEHGDWKEIVLPFFRRPTDPAVRPEFEAVLRDRLTEAIDAGPTEMIRNFALPVQSAALAVLLDTDRDIATEWEGWGLHAFRTDGLTDPDKATRFVSFIDRMLDRGRTDPGMGLFAALHTARLADRSLTRDEKRGICHLALSGGRDTVINAIVGTLAYLAEMPTDLDRLREDPVLIPLATEEIFRVLSPLPAIARVCPHGHRAGTLQIQADARAALCWAAANRDPDVFDTPGKLRIDRKPNPHVAFGAGTHTCLGAPMARLLIRTLLTDLSNRVDRVEVIDAVPRATLYGTPYLFSAFRACLHRRSRK